MTSAFVHTCTVDTPFHSQLLSIARLVASLELGTHACVIQHSHQT